MGHLPENMRIEGEWAISQKAPRNADLDQRMTLGLKGMRLAQGGSGQWGLVR